MPPVTPDVEHWLGKKKVTGLIISVITPIFLGIKSGDHLLQDIYIVYY